MRAALQKLRSVLVTAEDGVHPDIAAEMLGFTSGDELLQALSAIKDKPLKEVVDAETDRRMAETYGDMRTDGTLHAPKRASSIAISGSAPA